LGIDDLEAKGVSSTHIQVLRKFHVISGEIITDSSRLRGERGVSKIPPDNIVSAPHYMHNLVRGVYKPEGDEYALSIQMNPESKWGTEIDFETGKWKIDYDFGEVQKYSSDINALTKCMQDNVPIGIILKLRRGENQILGLGKITKADGSKFEIIPYDIDETVEHTEQVAYVYVKEQGEKNDYSSTGSTTTILTRAKTKFFRDSLLNEYDRKCVFCGFGIESYLIGAHIVPVGIMRVEDPENAMNPSDGLLLCRYCDKAYEDGDIQVNENYNIIKSEKLIKISDQDSSVNSWLTQISDKISIKENSMFKPNKKYLKKKTELV